MKDIDYSEWYEKNKEKYRLLANNVEEIVKKAITKEHIPIHHIESRLKSFTSFEQKMHSLDENKHSKYSQPIEIEDIAGIRIVVFLVSDLYLISQIIQKLFDIDWSNSVNKFKELKIKEVGYRSEHYVASFNKKTLASDADKYASFKHLHFEIQVKTLLDHAWSEIEHDRNYKKVIEFPIETDVPRRFTLLAGILEMVDYEFERLAAEIMDYEKHLLSLMKKGANVPISAYALREYLTKKFKDIQGFTPVFLDIDEVLDELNSMGIKTIGEFHNIIPFVFGNYYYYYDLELK